MPHVVSNQTDPEYYRCFADERPLSIEIKPGFTSLIGPNNSGKSSCLKFFHELRNVWSDVESRLVKFSGSVSQPTLQFIDVVDQLEPFHQFNDRPMTFDIVIDSNTADAAQGEPLSRISGRCERNRPSTWKIDALGANATSTEGRTQHFHADFTISKREGVETVFSPMREVIGILKNMQFVPPFRNAVNKPGGADYQFRLGADFVAVWDAWKNSGNKLQARRIQRVTDDIRRLFGFDQLEINASAGKDRLNVVVDGQPYNLYEQGAGLAQFIVVLANAAIARPSFILIDEPELNLHPSLQVKFLSSLASYAEYGTIFATHTVGLARSTAQTIYSFQRSKENSKQVVVRHFDDSRSYGELMGELSFSAHKDMGYDSVLLVEGPHDVVTIIQFLRKLGKDNRVVAVPLGGREMIHGDRRQALEEVRRLSDRVYALIDSDRSAAGAPVYRRIDDFARLCGDVGITCHVTDFREIENYLTDRAVKAAFGESFAALAPHQKPQSATNFWGKPTTGGQHWR